MKAFITAILLLSSALTVAEGTTYLCIEEHSGGVLFKNGAWDGVSFTAGSKYIIKQKAGESVWVVRSHGYAFDKYICPNQTGSGLGNDVGVLVCNSPVGYGVFKFNIKSHRFLATFAHGYVDGKDNDENSPYIGIGKCSQI